LNDINSKSESEKLKSNVADSKEEVIALPQDTNEETLSEVKYIVRSKYSEKFLLRYAWANTLRFPIVLVHIMSILAFIGAGIYYIVSANISFMGIAFPILGLILIPGMLFIANISVAKTMKKAYEKYGMVGDFTVDFIFGSNIIMRNSSTKMVSIFEYSDIKRMFSSLGLIIIETHKGYRILLDTKGFLKGERDVFTKDIVKIIRKK
jgi:hypothetical protein